MSVKSFIRVAAIAAVAGVWGLAVSSASASITIPTVPIGNEGNPPDPTTGSRYGSVAYSYKIGQTEVTNTQYAAFLNAVATTDTHGLYSRYMANQYGAITRFGSPGSYTYAPNSGYENYPVTHVTFWNATRFANWLHNGQPIGAQDNTTTEDGAYTLTPGGISANTITRNTGWQWAVTSENEWYKAAYYQPASQGGDADNYWQYPTSSNTINTSQANYGNVPGHTLSVGTYAANFYGTFDMAGNVWEWTEAIVVLGISRGIRGGGNYGSNERSMWASNRVDYSPLIESGSGGFRVSQVPGPGSVVLLAIGGLGALRRRRGVGR